MHQDIIEYVKRQIAGNARSSQPFRNRFEHTVRVYRWSERLHEHEGGDLNVIRIAALFHDAGWDDEIPHEIVSAGIARNYLSSRGYATDFIEQVCQTVANHNQRKKEIPLAIESCILMDADLLDELGAITIIWDAMAVALEDNPGYYKVYDRICRYLSKNKERISLMKTESGKRFYTERLQFIEHFVDNFGFELGLPMNKSGKLHLSKH